MVALFSVRLNRLLAKSYYQETMFLSFGCVRDQETASVMYSFNRVRCRSKHTKNFSENYQILTSATWHFLPLGDLLQNARRRSNYLKLRVFVKVNCIPVTTSFLKWFEYHLKKPKGFFKCEYVLCR